MTKQDLVEAIQQLMNDLVQLKQDCASYPQVRSAWAINNVLNINTEWLRACKRGDVDVRKGLINLKQSLGIFLEVSDELMAITKPVKRPPVTNDDERWVEALLKLASDPKYDAAFQRTFDNMMRATRESEA